MEIQHILSQAAQAEAENQWPQAAELYSAVLEHQPDNQVVKEKLAWCLSRSKQYDKALGTLHELFQSQPQNAKWPYMMGYQYHEQEKWREAIEWYAKALGIKPDYIVVMYRKGYAHFKLEQIRDALQSFERCRSLWHRLPDGPAKERDKKNCAKAAYHQAEALIENQYMIHGGAEGAIPLLDEAIQLNPDDHNAFYLKGKAYLECKEPKLAVAALERANQLKPNQDYILDRWAQALAQQGQLAEAEQIYQRIPPPQRKDYVLRNLADVQYEMGDFPRALQTIQRALSKNSQNHNGHYLLGKCYQATGDVSQAAAAYREAIRLRQRRYKKQFLEAETALGKLLSEHPDAGSAPRRSGRQRGKVKNYIENKGFGFVESSGISAFFHVKDCPPDARLQRGMILEYDIVESDKGPRAMNIRIVDSDRAAEARG